MSLQRPEVFLHDGHGLVRVDVADDGRDGVVRGIEGLEVFEHFLPRHVVQIASPADDRVAIGVRLKGRGVEDLPEQAARTGVGPHAPLLVHHVPFRIEFAEDGVGKAVRLQKGPHLQLIGGQLDEVLGGVTAGGSIQMSPAQPLVGLPEFILDDVFPLLPQGVGHRLIELSDPRFVFVLIILILGLILGRIPGYIHGRSGGLILGLIRLLKSGAVFAALAVELPINAVDLLHPGNLCWEVSGSVNFGSFEHHVFQQMRNAGPPLRIIDAPHAETKIERNGGRVVPFDHQNLHAVFEGPLDDVELHVLSAQGGWQGNCDDEKPDRQANLAEIPHARTLSFSFFRLE